MGKQIADERFDDEAPATLPGPSEEQIKRAARLMFDRAYPASPRDSMKDLDKWFADTYDYWIRAARELAAVLGTPMVVTCPCGWSVSGPAMETSRVSFYHKCDNTNH